jgi:5'-phosphate synthase pdxT subunit
MKKVAVLALQGAFAEHEKILSELGAPFVELRQKSDLLKSFDALILPGGESTVQGKLLHDMEMFGPLKERILGGTKVLGTCAGMILLAKKICNDDRIHFGTLPVCVRRNAYGRQLGSFFAEENFGSLGKIPMTFIRAPFIESVENGVEILATCGGKIVAVRFSNQTAVSFHPEIDENLNFFQFWLD